MEGPSKMIQGRHVVFDSQTDQSLRYSYCLELFLLMVDEAKTLQEFMSKLSDVRPKPAVWPLPQECGPRPGLAEMENSLRRREIRTALDKHDWNQVRAAKELGLRRTTFQAIVRRLGIARAKSAGVGE